MTSTASVRFSWSGGDSLVRSRSSGWAKYVLPGTYGRTIVCSACSPAAPVRVLTAPAAFACTAGFFHAALTVDTATGAALHVHTRVEQRMLLPSGAPPPDYAVLARPGRTD